MGTVLQVVDSCGVTVAAKDVWAEFFACYRAVGLPINVGGQAGSDGSGAHHLAQVAFSHAAGGTERGPFITGKGVEICSQ